jgi:hypothetical protein
MKSQLEKAIALRSLHERPGSFVIANAWDACSARMLSDEGFEALATSSGASAAAVGKTDGQLSRDEVLAHLRVIADATELPVSADLENGMSDTLEGIAETFRLAAAAGVVGGSIEDGPRGGDSLYDIAEAAERVTARVDDLRIRQHQVDEADVRKVVRHLVDEHRRRGLALYSRLRNVPFAERTQLIGREFLERARVCGAGIARGPGANDAREHRNVRQFHGAFDL